MRSILLKEFMKIFTISNISLIIAPLSLVFWGSKLFSIEGKDITWTKIVFSSDMSINTCLILLGISLLMISINYYALQISEAKFKFFFSVLKLLFGVLIFVCGLNVLFLIEKINYLVFLLYLWILFFFIIWIFTDIFDFLKLWIHDENTSDIVVDKLSLISGTFGIIIGFLLGK